MSISAGWDDMERMTTAEATIEGLIAHGIDTMYALPGVHNDHLFEALFKAKDRIRTVHTRHEQGAGYMALGAALATGKPAAFVVAGVDAMMSTSAWWPPTTSISPLRRSSSATVTGSTGWPDA